MGWESQLIWDASKGGLWNLGSSDNADLGGGWARKNCDDGGCNENWVVPETYDGGVGIMDYGGWVGGEKSSFWKCNRNIDDDDNRGD